MLVENQINDLQIKEVERFFCLESSDARGVEMWNSREQFLIDLLSSCLFDEKSAD